MYTAVVKCILDFEQKSVKNITIVFKIFKFF